MGKREVELKNLNTNNKTYSKYAKLMPNPSIGKVHHSGQLEASGRLRGARGGPAGRRGERNQGGDGSGDRIPVDRRLQVRLN